MNGIFQGDIFSAMLFCLALNPLSRTLNETSYGCSIGRDEGGYQLTHLLYMDDQKLCMPAQEQSCRVFLISDCNWDIRMRLSSKR